MVPEHAHAMAMPSRSASASYIQNLYGSFQKRIGRLLCEAASFVSCQSHPSKKTHFTSCMGTATALPKETTVGPHSLPPVPKKSLCLQPQPFSTQLNFRSSTESNFCRLSQHSVFRHMEANWFRLARKKHPVVENRVANQRRRKCFCKQFGDEISRPAETTHQLAQQRV